MATDRKVSRATGAVVCAVILVGAIATVVLNAPANWLALYLADRSGGVLLLADATGTVWSGSAVVAVASPGGSNDRSSADQRTPGALALPGRVTWTLEIERGLAPVLHLTHDGVLLQPLSARVRDGALVLDAGAAAMPASMLRLAGAPLNTLLPEGRCELRWNGLRFGGRGAPVGEGTLRVASFSLALSPVKPLGDYLVSWTSGERGVTWQVGTERGPLDVQGGGGGNQVRVAVRIARDAPPAVAAQLNPLLDMIGRQGPDEAIIQTGRRP